MWVEPLDTFKKKRFSGPSDAHLSVIIQGKLEGTVHI